MNKNLILIIAFALFATVLIIFLVKNPKGETTKGDETVSATQTPSPHGWIQTEMRHLGMIINHPQNLKLQPLSTNSVMLLDELKQSPVGPINYIYFSYIPSLDSTTAIYNLNPIAFKQLLTLDVGESSDLSFGTGQAEWYTYTRKNNERIGNHVAFVFVNQKPWEFPGGTEEIRYIVANNQSYYLLGAYYQPDAALSLENINNIIRSLQFVTIEVANE